MSHTYAPAPSTPPKHATTPTHINATTTACTHTNATAPPPSGVGSTCFTAAALSSGLQPCHLLMLSSFMYTKLGQHIIWPWCVPHTHTLTRGTMGWALPISPIKFQSC
ncbi:hypothetical protein O181_041066 [Austropuccinia psidii MF-1]|uniref:Uncharacterized protein n=1 Tax=Austropuccinia psidii MF-1 TaxID=1389203 RepID=A0A9Q3DJ10_9BASI|nr:hypothetical protein [Austropuccinia psidii MF-1]